MTDGRVPDTYDLPLSDAQLQRPQKIVTQYAHIFALGDCTLQPVASVSCEIVTEMAQKPISQPPYPLSDESRRFVRDQLITLLNQRLIKRSSSPWASPMVVARKIYASTGECSKKRFYINYVKLNGVTKRDKYLLQRIDTLFESALGKRFSQFDEASGF